MGVLEQLPRSPRSRVWEADEACLVKRSWGQLRQLASWPSPPSCLLCLYLPFIPPTRPTLRATERRSSRRKPTGRSVNENTTWFEPIGAPVTATDPNSDKLTYSLANARTSYFTIDAPSGLLQVGAPLDYETVSSYTVTVIATDPSGAKDTITVTVSVNNVDERGKVSLTWTKPQVDTEVIADLKDPDGSVSGTTWQWSSSTIRDSGYTDISGAASASYTPTVPATWASTCGPRPPTPTFWGLARPRRRNRPQPCRRTPEATITSRYSM